MPLGPPLRVSVTKAHESAPYQRGSNSTKRTAAAASRNTVNPHNDKYVTKGRGTGNVAASEEESIKAQLTIQNMQTELEMCHKTIEAKETELKRYRGGTGIPADIQDECKLAQMKVQEQEIALEMCYETIEAQETELKRYRGGTGIPADIQDECKLAQMKIQEQESALEMCYETIKAQETKLKTMQEELKDAHARFNSHETRAEHRTIKRKQMFEAQVNKMKTKMDLLKLELETKMDMLKLNLDRKTADCNELSAMYQKSIQK
jgi:cytochrome c556